MSVRKFRDVADMPGPPRYDRGDPRLWRSVAAWMGLANRLSGRRWPPGVFKDRSIEDANRRREAWQAARD